MRTTLLSILVACTILSASGQGCDTLFIGTVDGISTGANDTPFPTQANAGSRVQYLFHASELSAFGCSNVGTLTGLCLELIDSDPAAVYLDVQVKLKNTVLSSFTNFEVTGLGLYASVFGLHVDQGTLCIPFDVPFQWDLVSNVVVEIAYTRIGGAGNDPRVSLDLGLPFTATRWAQDASFSPGWSIDDDLPLTALRGTETSRPVVGFILALSSSVNTPVANAGRAIHPNPATDHVTIDAAALQPGDDQLILLDADGRTVATQPLVTTDAAIIDVEHLRAGIYLVQAIGAKGGRRSIGRVAVQ